MCQKIQPARGAAVSIKPGVERSETPGSSTQETYRAREAGDSGFDYKNIIRDDSSVGYSAGCE
jgi:hypothetical protein